MDNLLCSLSRNSAESRRRNIFPLFRCIKWPGNYSRLPAYGVNFCIIFKFLDFFAPFLCILSIRSNISLFYCFQNNVSLQAAFGGYCPQCLCKFFSWFLHITKIRKKLMAQNKFLCAFLLFSAFCDLK